MGLCFNIQSDFRCVSASRTPISGCFSVFARSLHPIPKPFSKQLTEKKSLFSFLCCFHPTLCVRLVVLSAALFIHDDFEANVNELIWTHRPKVTDSIYCVVFSLSHVLCVAVAAFNLIRLLFSFLLLLICTIRRCECVCVCVEKRPHAVTFSRWYGNRTFSFEPL